MLVSASLSNSSTKICQHQEYMFLCRMLDTQSSHCRAYVATDSAAPCEVQNVFPCRHSGHISSVKDNHLIASERPGSCFDF